MKSPLAILAMTLLTATGVGLADDTKTPAEVAAEATRKLLAYQTKDARSLLEPVAESAATEPAVAVALGRLLEQEKKYDESADMLRKAFEKTPGDASAYVYLGETQLRAKKTADAEASFRKAAEVAQLAVEKTPEDASAHYFLGVALQRQKKYEDAYATLEKSLKLDPENAMTLYQLGATRAFQQKWPEAVEALTRAIEKSSGIAYAYYYRGLAQDKLGKKDQLVLDLDRFLKLAPEAPEADRAKAILKAVKK